MRGWLLTQVVFRHDPCSHYMAMTLAKIDLV